MRLDNLLRFDYWLDASVTAQPAGPAMWLAVVAGVIGCFVVGWLGRSGRASRDITLAWIVASGLVALVGLGRLFAIPVIGWRVGWLVAALLALAPLAKHALGRAWADGLATDCLHALSFGPPRAAGDWSATTAALWLATHWLGLSVVFANLNLSLLLAPALLAFLLAPLVITAALGRARRRSVRLWTLSSLSPLTITYLTTGLSFSGVRFEGVLSGVLSPLLSLIVTSALAFVIGGRWAAQRLEMGDVGFVRQSAMLLVAASIGWSAWAAMVLHTHGVTGSDPYAYAQMGVDLVTRGTVFHAFPLARLTYALDIPSHPIVHVGYRIPDGAGYESTTVWPPGYAVFTGLAYLLAGERGLYLITPLLNLIALGVVAWFAYQVSGVGGQGSGVRGRGSGVRGRGSYEGEADPKDAGRSARYAIAALTVFFTATSYQQVEWQMMPMADIAAQLFSILALTLALRARGSLLMAGLSGLALGIAFDIRYTQVLMAPAIALALAPSGRETQDAGRRTQDAERKTKDARRKTPDDHLTLTSYVLRLASSAIAALIAALPVLAYHQYAFGNPLVTGSEELAHFSLAGLPETAMRTLGELNHYREFGLLAPLIALGLVAALRQHRRALVVLAVMFIILFGFHAAYHYLKLRDILFIFPVISWLAALGAVELWRMVSGLSSQFLVLSSRPSTLPQRRDAQPFSIFNFQFSIFGRLLMITTICGMSFLFVLRSMETLALPVTRGFGGFGYLVREQRLSFDRLRQMTPDDVAIGCSLNSGAVDLHAQRMAFRPAGWTPDELTRFVDALHAQGRPVFLLDDGAELQEALATLRARYALREVGRLDVPYYEAVGGGSQNRRVPLFKIEARR
ncbi:MAG: hypothetical protein RMN52_01790 [Anaerolineae bacterium]|nr:hypothetical protein [Candidatus Roseilinea sp.]MDW8448711.1 hypothetical protein [Anaerolineae bacterium]